jgi:energy-coupling factor transport system substrate-specific component
MKRIQSGLSLIIFALTALLGVGAFLYPFWLPAVAQSVSAGGGMAHTADAALLLTVIVAICFAVLLVEVQSEAVSAKAIALMGVLVAMNSVLRFAEVAIPMPGGFSPIFPLILLGGYVFGARIGFLLGSLTILASALITGGVGPWMPYQMLTAGWVGMSAVLVRVPLRALRRAGAASAGAEVALLAAFGIFWGFAYGMIMNIWFWPFAMGPSSMYWQPGIGAWETLQRYAVFYAVTSLAWDVVAAVGNALLIVLLGSAVLRILRRFHRRFDFAYIAAPLYEAQPAHSPPAHAPRGQGALAPAPMRSRA